MRWLSILTTLLCIASYAAALESPSADTGRILFDSRQLGESGKSCSSCHPDGKGLAGVRAMDNAELAETINLCITQPLDGKALDPASTEMASMIMYLRELESTD